MAYPTTRFAVLDSDGRSSNSWRVWTHGGDVYISCRDNYKEFKASLHASGRWRAGLTAEGAAAAADRIDPDGNRAWEVWDRPTAIDGVTPAFQIWFLRSELALSPDVRETVNFKKTTMLNMPEDCELMVATIIVKDTEKIAAIEGVADQILTNIPIGAGGSVQVSLYCEPMNDARRRMLAGAYQGAIAVSSERDLPLPDEGRLILHGNRGEVRFAVELNAKRPDPDPLGIAAMIAE